MDYSCPRCLNEFNSNNFVARTLATCGHSLCSSCLEALLKDNQSAKCPLDGAKFSRNETQINYSLMQIIEQREAKKFCQEHKDQEVTLICVEDRSIGCLKCFFGPQMKHQNHRVLLLEEFLKQANDELKKLVAALAKLNLDYRDGKNFIKEKSGSLKQKVNSHFDKIIQELNLKRGSLLAEIESFFTQEISKLNNSFGPRSHLYKEISQHFSDKKALLKNKDYLKILELNAAKIKEEIKELKAFQHITKLKDKLNHISKSFTSTMRSRFSPIPNFPISFSKFTEIDLILDREKSKKKVKTFQIKNQSNKLCVFQSSNLPLLKIDNLDAITRLEISLSDAMTKQTDIDNLNKILIQLPNLTQAYIDADNHISESLLERFFGGLILKLKNIKLIDIRFRKAKDSHIRLLLAKLAEARHLSSLSLDFSYSKVIGSTLNIINERFQNLKNLNEFKLDLSRTNIDDDDLEELALPFLSPTQITFCFYRTKKITEEGFDCLLEYLKNGYDDYNYDFLHCFDCKTIIFKKLNRILERS